MSTSVHYHLTDKETESGNKATDSNHEMAESGSRFSTPNPYHGANREEVRKAGKWQDTGRAQSQTGY